MAHYNKAPITEALIDIRAASSTALQFEALHALKEHLPDYPVEEIRNLAEGVIQFGPTIQTEAKQKPWALLLRNNDNNQIVQFRTDGFSFSRLEPYQDWEHLRNEGRRLWDIYRQLIQPKEITRVALRYINRFDLVGERIEPEDYFNVYPAVPAKLPVKLRDFGPFLLNLRMPQHDLGGLLVLNQGNAPPKGLGTVPIILDLDLYVENPPINDEEELWQFFQQLRERKNLYFEASITDKTRELIR